MSSEEYLEISPLGLSIGETRVTSRFLETISCSFEREAGFKACLFFAGEILFERAVEVVDPVVFKGDDLFRNGIEKVAVVGCDDGCSFVIFKAPSERGNRFEVEVVVRLIEDERVVVAEHHARKNQPGCFSAGELGDRLERIVPAEEHFAENAADLLIEDAFSALLEPVKGILGCFLLIDFGVVLREIADLHLMPDFNSPLVWGKTRASILRKVVLPRPLFPMTPILSPSLDLAGEVFDHRFAVVAFGDVFDFEDDLARGFFRRVEADVGALDIRFFQFLRLEAVDLADARLHLARSSSGAESSDELLQLRDLFSLSTLFSSSARSRTAVLVTSIAS